MRASGPKIGAHSEPPGLDVQLDGTPKAIGATEEEGFEVQPHTGARPGNKLTERGILPRAEKNGLMDQLILGRAGLSGEPHRRGAAYGEDARAGRHRAWARLARPRGQNHPCAGSFTIPRFNNSTIFNMAILLIIITRIM